MTQATKSPRVRLAQANYRRLLSEMRGWIWGCLGLAVGPLSIFFWILPNPTVLKSIVTWLLLGSQTILGYQVFQNPKARLWWLYMTLCCFNMMIFCIGLALAEFKLQLPLLLSSWLVMTIVVCALFAVQWRLYTPIVTQHLQQDTQTGRFDLQTGTFDFMVPPSSMSVQYRSEFMRRVAAIVISSSSTLVILAAIWGRELNRMHSPWRDLIAGGLFLGFAIFLASRVVVPLYIYRWIRRWEKATSRTMWIKGFEPGAESRP